MPPLYRRFSDNSGRHIYYIICSLIVQEAVKYFLNDPLFPDYGRLCRRKSFGSLPVTFLNTA